RVRPRLLDRTRRSGACRRRPTPGCHPRFFAAAHRSSASPRIRASTSPPLKRLMLTRRHLLSSAALLGSTALLKTARAGAEIPAAPSSPHFDVPPNKGPFPYTPVETPNGATLPWKMDGGVKVFHLIAEEVQREFAPGMIVHCWGYNGITPGPTIE